MTFLSKDLSHFEENYEESKFPDSQSWIKNILEEFVEINVDEEKIHNEDVDDCSQCLVSLWQCFSKAAESGVRYMDTSGQILR